jgi:hypothetical protein
VPAAAQATDPPYLAQFPTVDKVVKAMVMPDPRESALRKMGALWQLQEVIKQLSGRREFRGFLPDEMKLLGQYQVAEYYIGQAIDSAFPGRYGNWPKVSMNTPYRYMRTDPRFGVEGVELAKLLPVSVLEAFSQSVGNDKARWAARARADSEEMRRVQVAAEPSKLEQEQAAMRRCAESGRGQTQCMMEGIGKSFIDMASSAVPGLGGLLRGEAKHGLRMGGVYPGTNKLSFTFFSDFVSVGCSDLVPENHDYTLAIAPDGVRITITSEPRNIVLTMRSDGRLYGPGPTDIQGQVQTGIQYGTRTWSDGRTEPISRPVFETMTRRCNLGQLSASGPSTTGTVGSAVSSMLNLATGSDPGEGSTVPAGLRMIGEYGTLTALDIEFRPEGAVVGCGDVTALRPYTGSIAGGAVVISVANGAAPFNLTVQSDGRLGGTGTVRVDGRKTTGTNGEGQLTYAPRSATCPLGILTPAGPQASQAEQGAAAARASLGIPSASAQPTGNGPAFQIVGGLPAPTSGGNAFAGAALLLLDVPLESVLKEAGVAQPAGTSAPKVLEQTCTTVAGEAACAKVVQGLGAHTVAQLKADAGGVANTPDLSAGKTYYLFGSAVSQGRKVTWHLPLKATPGWTRLVLSTANALP